MTLKTASHAGLEDTQDGQDQRKEIRISPDRWDEIMAGLEFIRDLNKEGGIQDSAGAWAFALGRANGMARTLLIAATVAAQASRRADLEDAPDEQDEDLEAPAEGWSCPYCGSEEGSPLDVESREFQGDSAHGGMVTFTEEMCTLCYKGRR